MSTNSQMTAELLHIFGKVTMRLQSGKAAQWLWELSKEQLGVIHAVFMDFEAKTEHEQSLLSYMLYPLRDGKQSTLGMYETLALNKAFLVPKVLQNHQYNFSVPQQIMLGLREQPAQTLDLSDKLKRRELEALAGFAFELYGQRNELFTSTYVRGTKTQYVTYKDPALKAGVARYPDRVEQLMYYARTRLADAGMLEVLMDEDNVTPLNDGLL